MMQMFTSIMMLVILVMMIRRMLKKSQKPSETCDSCPSVEEAHRAYKDRYAGQNSFRSTGSRKLWNTNSAIRMWARRIVASS